MTELKTYCSSLPCNNINFDIENKLNEIKDTNKKGLNDFIDRNKFLINIKTDLQKGIDNIAKPCVLDAQGQCKP